MPSSKPRFVPIRVDDPKVERLEVFGWRRDAGPEWFTDASFKVEVPVPLDDQLTRDIHEAIGIVQDKGDRLRHEAYAYERSAGMGSSYTIAKHRAADESQFLAARLRAAFSLNQEDE